MAATKYSSMGPPRGIDLMTHYTMSRSSATEKCVSSSENRDILNSTTIHSIWYTKNIDLFMGTFNSREPDVAQR